MTGYESREDVQASRKSGHQEKERRLLEQNINLEFSHPLASSELKEVRRRLSLLRREPNAIHAVNDQLIQIASGIRESMEGFVVASFLSYARHVGVLPNENSVLPYELPGLSVAGVREYFENSYRPDSWVSKDLWKTRWLLTMSNALRRSQSRASKLWSKDRLTIAKTGVTYTYHLDPNRKEHFVKPEDLTLGGMIDTFPSIDKLVEVDPKMSRDLITHSTSKKSSDSIFSAGFIAPYKHIRPLSLSEGVVSLPYSDFVIIFDPNVLKHAGFSLVRYDENPVDSDEILEVREPIPVPLFLASGIYDTAYFHPEKAQEHAHIWSLDEPSGAFGANELSTLQGQINKLQERE